MSLADLVHGMTTRYLVIDDRVYRLESVTSAALLRAGFPHLEGVSAVSSARDEDLVQAAGDEVLACGGTEEQAEVKREAMRTELAATSAKRTAERLATPEGREHYARAVQAYAIAAVSGIGAAPEPLLRDDPKTPAMALLPAAARAEVYPARLVDVPRDDRPADEVGAELAEQGLVPLWAVEPTALAYLGATASMLAAGRAASVAPFRGGVRATVRG